MGTTTGETGERSLSKNIPPPYQLYTHPKSHTWDTKN